MALRTSLCDRLEIDHPIVQAPIGSATTPELAAAVSNAGGLGHLAVTWRDLEETRAVIAVRSVTAEHSWYHASKPCNQWRSIRYCSSR